ncbi:coiled-coil domain-containing protein [Tepidibacter formicigenes]|jgi:DNA repair exonuclease SbcCD ATPase subunit|uniref:Chromosome segregation ATPase n=1 Tax=Tepidibacter formicigenes DSM 15518 TaxID=1123349 RepID=A0A1M6PKY1_9FIRM|nr:hypothetical protein [Tepidibacter formicigenes]SHK08543.1 Chromosome segregation ATPase [Tepidibacter formicigenes DSM 15518]
MPKLSKTRIINLNYNDGKRTIYNECFDYGSGKDTLFSMENGVGKTVLIQFFMQPFLKRKRDLAGRKFEDYFTNNTPTYIMHEILLENKEKFLVGMIIKRKTKDEEEKNSIRILAFTNKYKETDSFDIVNIPFIEGKTILRFSQAEKKVKDYSRRKTNFKVYNFNDNTKKNEYFNELEIHKINHKEWESIIKKINNDESGLSNLFDKCKTDEALIRTEIIPLIESKLNSEINQIEVIRENLVKYIENYKGSKDAIAKVRCFDEFIEDSVKIKEKMEEGANIDKQENNLLNNLSARSNLLDDYIKAKNKDKKDFENYILELKEDLRILNYEKLSYEYHSLDKDIKQLNIILESIQKNISLKNDQKEIYDKELNIQKAAEIYEKINDLNKKLSSVEERLANYEKEDSEISKNIKNYKFTLNELYDNKIKEKASLLEELKTNIEDIKKQVKNMTNEKVTINKELINISGNINAKEKYISDFEDKEQKLKSKYSDFNIQRNDISNEYNKNELEKYKKNLDKIEKNLEKEIIELNKNIEKIDKSINESIIKQEESMEKISKYKVELNQIQNDLEIFKEETRKIENILEIKHFERNVKKHKTSCLDKIIEDINNFELNKEKIIKKRNEIYDIILKYKTGLVNLPKELEKEFEYKDIEFEYGLSWLKKYKGSFEEKCKIIDINPFLPYSLVLSKKDYEVLKMQNIEVFTSLPIPIIDKNKLHEKKEIKILNSLLRIDNQDFILSFNKFLVDDEKREKLILEQENKINILDKKINKINQAIETNQGYKSLIFNYSFNGDEYKALNNDIEVLKNNIEKTNIELKDLKNLKEQYIKELKNLKDNLKLSLKELESLKTKKREFLDFFNDYQLYIENKCELIKLGEQLKINNERLLKIENEIQNLNDYEINKNIELRNIENEKKLIEYKKYELGDIKEGEFIKENINSIEGKLKACLEKYDADKKRDLEDKKMYQNDIKDKENKLNKIVKSANLSDEFCNVRYDEDIENSLEEKIKYIVEEINELKENYQKNRDQKLILEGELNAKRRELNKAGYTEPLALEEIKDINFKDRENRYKKDLKEYKEILQEYDAKILKLQSIFYRIEKFKKLTYENIDMKLDFDDIQTFEKQINDFLNEYETINKIYEKIEREISNLFVSSYEKYRDKYDLLKDRLFDFTKETNKIRAKGKFESLVEVIEKMRDTERLNLENIRNEEDMVIKQILRYSKNIYDEMKKIDKKSSIKIHGKIKKMLEIVIPEEIEEDGLKDFIKKIVDEVVQLEGSYKEIIDTEIKTDVLLGKLIGNINRIKVFINKIEKRALVKKRWGQALNQNSGGEKFVSMFILLASLMSYMRRRESEIGIVEDSKIIIMDNPFAKTNAEHLLEPMFDIANKYGIQLICFSGIGGSSVYNRFDRIYVAKVITDRFRNKDKVEFIKDIGKDSLEISNLEFTKEQISLSIE